MVRLLLPHAQGASEFGQYNGDCVVNAMLMALHARWPWRPGCDVSLATLTATTAEIIANWGAGPEGQWDDVSMASYLAAQGYATRQAGDTIAAGTWAAELVAHAGQLPAVLGVTNAQALPGNEAGVHNHGITLFGYDEAGGGVFLCGNGDALRADPTQIQAYSAADLAAAQLSSITWIEGPMLLIADPIPATYFTATADGSWACARTGHAIRGGMLAYYRSVCSPGDGGGVDVLGLPTSDEYAAGPAYTLSGAFIQPTYQDFEDGRLLYDPLHKLDSRPGYAGPVIPAKLPPPTAPAPPAAAVAALVAQLKAATSAAEAL